MTSPARRGRPPLGEEGRVERLYLYGRHRALLERWMRQRRLKSRSEALQEILDTFEAAARAPRRGSP